MRQTSEPPPRDAQREQTSADSRRPVSRFPQWRFPFPVSPFPLVRNNRTIWLATPIALLTLLSLAIALGSVPLSLSDVWSGLTGTASPEVNAIVRTLRLPRALLAMLVGAGLGMAGAALQGTLRNPLAEPYLLGVSGGAAVGAVVAVAFGLLAGGLLPLAAFAGALGAVAAALFVARAAGGGADPRVLLMAGVIIGAFANAAIMVALANAPPNTVRGALWWMMGSVADADWTRVAWLAAYVAVAGALLVWRAREIDVLALGEEPAAALGLDVDRAVMWIFVLASLLAAATVAAAGLIGFVGLVVPHLVRRAGVRRHRPLLVGSALTGGALVIAADIAARTATPPAELPLGAITALIGVPFFLVQLGEARMIDFDRVRIRYPRAPNPAVDDVSFVARRSAMTAVVGPNGSGKSTLVRALLRRQGLEHGQIRFDGAPLDGIDGRALARRLAIVPQREEATFALPVRDFVALGRFPHGGSWGASTATDAGAVQRAIARAGIAELADRSTAQLSGGEWQRARLARALAQGGEALVLDEPTTFLDIAHEMAMFELFAELAAEGMAVLVVSHQLNLVARFADQIVLLDKGRVAALGPPSEVMTAAVLERVYEWPLVVVRDPAVGSVSLLPLRRMRRA